MVLHNVRYISLVRLKCHKSPQAMREFADILLTMPFVEYIQLLLRYSYEHKAFEEYNYEANDLTELLNFLIVVCH